MDQLNSNEELSSLDLTEGPYTALIQHSQCPSDNASVPSSPRQAHPEEKKISNSKSQSIHISVQRSDISSTTVREGNDELDELDVEVYDQQVYEKQVFEQVNKAIDQVRPEDCATSSTSDGGHMINDLMRIIHSEDAQRPDEFLDDTADKDEQVLQLTRLERLNKNKKKRNEIQIQTKIDLIKALPRIPKIRRLDKPSEINQGFDSEIKKTTDSSLNRYRHQKQLDEKKIIESKNNEGYAADTGDEDHKPLVSEADNNDDLVEDDVHYDTDCDQEDVPDSLEKKVENNRKRLQDDGDIKCYQARIKAYSKEKAKLRLANILDDGTEFKKLDEMHKVDDELQIPKDLWENLFEHQKTGVRWLWELHQLGTGGILGDEMGLGKTIQMIAFLTALKTSDVVNTHNGYKNLGPVILVCPATVMHQWLLEFRKWWPPFRVAILHNTGTFSGNRKNLAQIINKSGGVLIVSYQGVIIYQDQLHAFDWHYAILDEGHKIRNPDAQVTLACKRFRTPHRIILSGSPVQNNLRELWSIFDFIYPGKLGTLPVFMEQFSTPITQGGYANASDIQVQIAYKCSCVLRDTIKPFLLRRTKAEVNHKLKLPERSEQVLFCKLTDRQRKMYQAYLDSPTVRDIKRGMCQIFVGLTQLRKICNHPDLFDASDCQNQINATQNDKPKKYCEFFSEDETFGHFKKSGKLMVVDALLKLWKKQNHKVLLFTQSRQMLQIFKKYLDGHQLKYLVMDGTTPIAVRQSMVEEFNKKEDLFIFLLTTRVGGVGVNLIGANRIIIYDPDWNPSTDIQARERAWRIGQQRHVIIYRLLTAGTIEEKIYHRQVFKLYLTNRVLRDAKQKRFFKTNDLHELFTLGDNDKNIETKALFDDDLQIDLESIKDSKRKSKLEKKKKRKQKHDDNLMYLDAASLISKERLEEMREKAKQLSQMISCQYGEQGREETQVNDQVRIKIEPGTSPYLVEARPSLKVKTESGPISSDVSVENRPCALMGEPSKPAAILKKVKLGNSRNVSKKQHVEYLVKQDVYRPDSGDEKPDPRYKRDDYILEQLFKSSNIFGALKHDKIETDFTSDFKVVESEAEKVARDAIRALRESRRHCLDSSSGVPNWTGRNGQVAARPRLMLKNKSRIQTFSRSAITSSSISATGSSSEDSLLSSIRKRNQNNPVNVINDIFNVANESDEEEGDKDFQGKSDGTGAENMADKIRDFLLFSSSQKSGEAHTEELLEFFKSNFNPDKTPIFKALLYKMCVFNRRDGRGFWVIKTEFRDV